MIKIDFDGRNPELAAKIANEMVNAYIFDQMNAKYQASRRAGDWLQERLQNLRDQAAAAERAVVQFKAKNNMVSAGGGTLINEQQLGEISGDLGRAGAHAADLQARLERMDAVRQTYQQEYSTGQRGLAVDENFSEAMSNSIITPLRAKYLDLVNREADWAARYGASHVAVVNLRNQIRDIRRSIYDELGRIQETTRSELELAKKRQNELETALTKAVSKTQDTNQAQVTLFSLEAAAKSYRSLYDNFLRQHTESVQEQTYPISDARLISSAAVTQTGPQKMKTWLSAIFLRRHVRRGVRRAAGAARPRIPNQRPGEVGSQYRVSWFDSAAGPRLGCATALTWPCHSDGVWTEIAARSIGIRGFC